MSIASLTICTITVVELKAKLTKIEIDKSLIEKQIGDKKEFIKTYVKESEDRIDILETISDIPKLQNELYSLSSKENELKERLEWHKYRWLSGTLISPNYD